VADPSRDYRRAERVLSLLGAGRADSPDGWLDAAVVLHHGTCPADAACHPSVPAGLDPNSPSTTPSPALAPGERLREKLIM
jgi:hypothetical protein